MSLKSVNALSELTGIDRRTIKKRLKTLAANKEGRAYLYESTEALPLIYDLGEANTPQVEMARYNKIRADRGEFDLSVAKGEVCELALLELALAKVAKLINSILDSLPLRLKKRMPKLNAKDIEYIRRVIVKVQNEVSEIQLK